MTKFEQAVEIIANDFRNDNHAIEYFEPETVGDIFEGYGYDSADLREEFAYILREAGFEDVTDDLEVIDGDKFYTFRKLASAVRKVRI